MVLLSIIFLCLVGYFVLCYLFVISETIGKKKMIKIVARQLKLMASEKEKWFKGKEQSGTLTNDDIEFSKGYLDALDELITLLTPKRQNEQD